MAKRSPVGWIILGAIVALIAIFVSVPVALLTLAFVSGAPLFTIMIGASVLGALSLPREFDKEFGGMSASMLPLGLGDQAEVMSTIPLFIFAGYLLAESGAAERLVKFANAALGWIPGGLAIVTVGTCALFTVFTGASGVTIIALGGVLMPALVRTGYDERFSMGLIAGTGSVGLLFPPALPLIIYGTICGLNIPPEWGRQDPAWEWNGARFLFSGVLPGFLLIGMLCALAVTIAIVRKLPRTRFWVRQLAVSFVLALPELVIPFGVIAGLATGYQLSEVAALTVLYTLVLELGVSRLLLKLGVPWGGKLEVKVLWTMSREAMAMIGAIFIIIFASQVLTNYMVTAKIPDALVHWTGAHVDSKIVFLLAINVILLIVGTVMDIFSAIVVVLPLLLGIAHHYGISPYHLGVIFLLNLEVGYLHPPVGLNLFITSVKFQRPITEVMWATIPFLVTMIVALLVITYVPSITELSTPEPPRTEPISNLTTMVKTAYDELTVVKDVKLVDVTGAPIKDSAGKEIVKHLAECDAAGSGKEGCQRLFFDVKGCNNDAKCTNEKIAKWVVDNNITTAPLDKQIVLVTEVPLVTSEGMPKKDKSGQPIVKKLAECAKETDVESCRELFLTVSNCMMDPDGVFDGSHGDASKCISTKVDDWITSNMPDAP
jgi:tripartite ATP-independent transporter DctM subunit